MAGLCFGLLRASLLISFFADRNHGASVRANDSMEDQEISLTEPSPPNSSPEEGAVPNILLPPLNHPVPPLPADLQLPRDLENLYRYGKPLAAASMFS